MPSGLNFGPPRGLEQTLGRLTTARNQIVRHGLDWHSTVPLSSNCFYETDGSCWGSVLTKVPQAPSRTPLVFLSHGARSLV
jgi:hypothetical protein